MDAKQASTVPQTPAKLDAENTSQIEQAADQQQIEYQQPLLNDDSLER